MNVTKVSDYFLGTFDAESGDNISHKKLQKLLYYAQGFHLAMHDGKTLFSNPIEAWEQGPVVRQVYEVYSGSSWQALNRPDGFEIYMYLPEERELLDAVYRVYGKFSAGALSEMTHQESPWLSTYDLAKGGRQSTPIERAKIRSYFTTIVEAGQRNESVDGRPVWPTNEFRFQRRAQIAARISSVNINFGAIAADFSAEPDPIEGRDEQS